MAMLSRVAEHLYWMARYLERAENTARLITVNANLILDLPKSIRPGWDSLIAITGSRESFFETHNATTESNVIRFLLADNPQGGSILCSLRFARENARTIRDIIPREAWEQINDLYLRAHQQLSDGLSARRRFGYLKEVILGVQQVAGIASGTMSHDAGYEFYRLGCNLERADMTTRIIDVRYQDYEPNSERAEVVKSFENILWMSVLKSLTAYQMYRRHRQAAVNRREVVDFLLLDAAFPRSVRFCVDEMADCLLHLPRSSTSLELLKAVDRLISECCPASIEQAALHEFIDELQIRLGALHNAIKSSYFDVFLKPAEAKAA